MDPEYRLPYLLPSAGSVEQEQWYEENEGKSYQNRVRLTLSRKGAEETYAMLKARADGDMDTEMPLFSLYLKGASFGEVFSIWNQMSDLLKTEKFWSYKSASERKGVLKSLYRLKITTKKEQNEKKQEYYRYVCEVSLGDVTEALRFEKLIVELDEFPFFGKKVETVSDHSKYDKAQSVLADVEKQKKEERNKEEVMEDKDLPFE
jgi:hypothetical protein